MDAKDGSRPVRTSDRLKQRRKGYGRSYTYYYTPKIIRKSKKSKRRTAAAQIAQMYHASVETNLRRSTRQRKSSLHLEDYETNSSRSDDDLMTPSIRPSKRKAENSVHHEEISTYTSKQVLKSSYLPRREGLRPRKSDRIARIQTPFQQSEDEHESSDAPDEQDETENGDALEEDNGNEAEGEEAEDDEVDEEDNEEEEEEDDEEDEEEQGRKRYDLRNRAEVRRSPDKEGSQRARSPRRVLHHGMGSGNKNKDMRKGSSRVHKRPRFSRIDDSDDSLLVDELDEGPSNFPWMRGGKTGAPMLFGGLEMHASTSWGLNAAASGWGHQGDSFASITTGTQTAGPSSKGGADIQPLQVDESVSFDDIGGLSEYVDALKEMVFFPLLYPDFFANYHITPPRGVLLCGPPGTGKTLIARALACAASKAGQKVSFYMRKGADVLSKWVGEAERQLKMLFEEAQRNQPSIIFFDEIDGLAPVRSSKQEQIHNSIVSTLLALMDGLDSRGQVVLIGATNRIDAIDGALRRPGRFDREFNFPLPGCDARAEILDIHTRKWKEPPAKDLKMELAASCVGYCGADLKALCTEAAIRAFREKYPQVYTSDDKYVIDVDSIKVEKYHFLEAMTTLTPAAHRGSIVHSRPLSSVVAPCLGRHVRKIMEIISNIFPYVSDLDMNKLSVFSYGSALPLVYRPGLLICGDESVGLDHIAPAVLHELEKFPVHSLGLPSLLSDPSAKTPEEALVHIFGEARRTTPSILYLPQFQLWWDTAHDQLKAVLMTLLAELPSDLPILLLGTSSELLSKLEEDSTSVFAPQNVYLVDKPTTDDRFEFVEKLVDLAFSIRLEEQTNKSKEPRSLPELPKAPKEVSGLKTSELKAKAEAEQHALRRLRMCLRDVCNRILYDKRFSVFHYPVSDEDAPNYRSIVQNPMDMATLLQRVDCGQYLTRASFLHDFDLIVANAKVYNGDDYNGSRIVSRAHELRDVVQGMLSQMDPALVAFCDKIAEQGGPVQVPDDVGGLSRLSVPVVQLASVTRSSARLRNVQPEVNLSQSYEALKRAKKNSEHDQAGSAGEEKSCSPSEQEQQHPIPSKPGGSPTQEPDSNGLPDHSDKIANNANQYSVSEITNGPLFEEAEQEDAMMIDDSVVDISDKITTLKQQLKDRTNGYGIPQLERLHSRVLKAVMAIEYRKEGKEGYKHLILRHLLKFAEDDDNF